MIFETIIFSLLLLLFFYLIFQTLKTLLTAPFVPTRKADLLPIFDLAEIKSGDVFFDLGCGDGRVLIEAAKKGAKAVGFEISFFPFLLCFFRILLFRIKTRKSKDITCPQVKWQSFWTADFKKADIIYGFLMPKVYKKLEEKIKKESKPNTRLILYCWPLPNIPFTRQRSSQGQTPIFLYRLSQGLDD